MQVLLNSLLTGFGIAIVAATLAVIVGWAMIVWSSRKID